MGGRRWCIAGRGRLVGHDQTGHGQGTCLVTRRRRRAIYLSRPNREQIDRALKLLRDFLSWQWSSNKKKKKRRGKEGGVFVVLTVLFCGVSTEATCQLLRIGASQPEAHHESARLCFFYRPKLKFFSLVFILNLMQ
jgi:hypothetical protein